MPFIHRDSPAYTAAFAGITKNSVFRLFTNSSTLNREPWNFEPELRLFACFMKGYLSILSNNVIVILIAYHGHQTSLFRVPLS
jgi:hypothetical protein